MWGAERERNIDWAPPARALMGNQTPHLLAYRTMLQSTGSCKPRRSPLPCCPEALFCHALGTLQPSRKKINPLFNPVRPHGERSGFMGFAQELSYQEDDHLPPLNVTGPGMVLGKRPTHGQGTLHFLKDSFKIEIHYRSFLGFTLFTGHITPQDVPSALPHWPAGHSENMTEML